jgi:citrate lyase subunit beta/citryl-CoA lyase
VILHRSLLFVPGSRAELLDKAARYAADVLCLDLEESVLPDDKPRARELVAAAIAKLADAGRTVQVRLNSIQSEETKADLAAVAQTGLSSVLLAKTQSPQDVRDVDVLLREQELAHEITPGTIELVIAIESAEALLRCEAISHASTRIVALMLGAEDYTFDMGVQRTPDGREIDYARSVIATCARAANLYALDTPWPELGAIDTLVADASRARTVGFSGKYVIHPTHIDPVHAVFSPTEADIAQARSVLTAWDGAQAKGLGAVQLDGRMVDRPIVERARRAIEQAEAIAKAATLEFEP